MPRELGAVRLIFWRRKINFWTGFHLI